MKICNPLFNAPLLETAKKPGTLKRNDMVTPQTSLNKINHVYITNKVFSEIEKELQQFLFSTRQSETGRPSSTGVGHSHR